MGVTRVFAKDTATGASVQCPILVGRKAYLEALHAELTKALYGQCRIVAVTGDAGIGKSRVVAEVRQQAAHLGFVVVQGNCYEADRSLPFAPFVDLLQSLLPGRPALEWRHLLGPAAAELVKLSPDVAGRLSGVVATATLEPAQERRRLFEALVQTLSCFAQCQPTLVILEDLHWADEASIDFILHFIRRACVQTVPFFVVLTYRGDDVTPHLSHLLAELGRQRSAIEHCLPPLSPVEVEEMVRAIFDLDYAVQPDFLQALSQLTEGNPFFVEEVLRSLVTAGDIFRRDGRWDRRPLDELRIPRTIRDAVEQRISRLTPSARQALTIAAVMGYQFESDVLQTVLGVDEHNQLRTLRELVGAQLVVEESADQFAFRHALTRQAVLSRMLATERRAIHRQIAQALEPIAGSRLDRYLNDLAHHTFEAGMWAKALDYGQGAGERALALSAPSAALEFFARATEAAHRLGSQLPLPLLRARGQAREILGDFEPARVDYETALESARRTGDRRAQWQALLDLGFLWAARDYPRSGGYFQQGRDLSRELADPPLLAQSLNRVGNWHVNVGQPRAGRQLHDQALAIFEGIGDQRGVAETLDLLGLATMHCGDWDRSMVCYDRAAEIFRELEDRRGEASCLAMLAQTIGVSFLGLLPGSVSNPSRGIAYGERAVELARGITWRSGETFALTSTSLCFTADGCYEQALATAKAGLAVAQEIEHQQWITLAMGTLGTQYLDLLAYPLARRYLESALVLAQNVGSVIFTHWLSAALARTYSALGELDRSEQLLASVLRPTDIEESGWQWLCWAARAELALARGEPLYALEILDRTATLAGDRARLAENPIVLLLRGMALSKLSRNIEADVALTTALNSLSTKRLATLRWQIHAARGRLYQESKRLASAAEDFAAARVTMEALAASMPDEPIAELGDVSLRANFLGSADARLPRSRRITSLRAAKAQFDGLTSRERDVASLIAQGMSNRLIAQALVISETTVETHVSSILGKLGCSSRAQVAAWASAKGLA